MISELCESLEIWVPHSLPDEAELVAEVAPLLSRVALFEYVPGRIDSSILSKQSRAHALGHLRTIYVSPNLKVHLFTSYQGVAPTSMSNLATCFQSRFDLALSSGVDPSMLALLGSAPASKSSLRTVVSPLTAALYNKVFPSTLVVLGSAKGCFSFHLHVHYPHVFL